MENPIRVPIPSSRGAGLQILGVLSSKENHLYYGILSEKLSICNDTIKDFFTNLNKMKCLENCIVVLDRHPAQLVATIELLKELKAIPLKLPVNTSIFNSVEYCWGWMK